MPGKGVVISGKASVTIIMTEIVLLMLVAWVYAGMPGLHRETSPATVTIQFGPTAPPSSPLSRSHQI